MIMRSLDIMLRKLDLCPGGKRDDLTKFICGFVGPDAYTVWWGFLFFKKKFGILL